MGKRHTSVIIQFIILTFTFALHVKAQISISGKITDADQNPVNHILVEIIDENDTTNIYSDITDDDGFFLISNIFTDVNPQNQLPENCLLLSNYPNPFNPSTIIYFETIKSENIEIVIYDILGREVKILYHGHHASGIDQIIWDGTNHYNQPVSAGIYLCRLKTKDNFKVSKMVLIDGGSTSLIGTNKISKSFSHHIAKGNSVFNFTVKVSGDSILDSEFRNFICTQDTTLNLKVSRLLRQATIGVEGGTLEIEEFKLSVPSGAFTASSELELFKMANDSVLGENGVTHLFRVDGIPEDFYEPLEVKIKYSGTLDEVNYIAVGSDMDIMLPDTNYTDIVYFSYDASEANGFLVGEIPPNTYNTQSSLAKSNDGGVLSFYLGGYTSENEWNPLIQHFVLRAYPKTPDSLYDLINNGYDEILLDKLELSYDRWFTLLGSDLDVLDIRTVVFCSYLEVYESDIQAFGSPENIMAMYIGRDNDFSEIFFQVNYGVACTYLWTLYDKERKHDWLVDAFAKWSGFSYYFWMHVIREYEIYYYINYCLDGLYVGKSSGNPLIFEYLVNRYGELIVQKIFNEIKNGKNSFDAIFSQTEQPELWLADFYEYLITNETIRERITRNYNLIDFWQEKTSAEFLVDSETHELERTDSFLDLSAKLYRVSLGNDLQDGDRLYFSTLGGGNAEISLFKYNQTDIEFMNSSVNGLTVENIKELSDNGYELLAIITNRIPNYPNTNTTNITLKIERLENQEFAITGCSIVLNGVRGALLKNGQPYLNDWLVGIAFDKDTDEANVTFENNTLIQQYENYDNGFGETFTEYIEIHFNDQADLATSFYAHRVKVTSTYTLTTTLSANNIPFNTNYNNEPWLNYELKGTDVCSGITTVSYEKVSTDNTTLSLEEGSTYCTSGSGIDIYIYRE